jgi:hypothetical protein
MEHKVYHRVQMQPATRWKSSLLSNRDESVRQFRLLVKYLMWLNVHEYIMWKVQSIFPEIYARKGVHYSLLGKIWKFTLFEKTTDIAVVFSTVETFLNTVFCIYMVSGCCTLNNWNYSAYSVLQLHGFWLLCSQQLKLFCIQCSAFTWLLAAELSTTDILLHTLFCIYMASGCCALNSRHLAAYSVLHWRGFWLLISFTCDVEHKEYQVFWLQFRSRRA